MVKGVPVESPNWFPIGLGYVKTTIHFIAVKQIGSTTIAGFFHIEASLGFDDLLKRGLAGDIAALAQNIGNEISTILSNYHLDRSTGNIIVIALSSQEGAPELLQSQLNQYDCNRTSCPPGSTHTFIFPVYVLYVDNTNHVQGYCVGPCPANQQQILNDLAGVQFGVNAIGDPLPTVTFAPGGDIVLSIKEPKQCIGILTCR